VISSIAATALILIGVRGFYMEITNGMALAVKNDSRAIVGEKPATAEQLRQRLTNAKDELTGAIENADLEQITALRTEIKSLPEQITVKEIYELKLRLLEIEKERQRNTDKIKDIMAVRREKNIQYVEKVRELEPFRQQVDEYETRLSFAKNDDILLLQERRELNAKLFNLSESMRDETL
jgi:chromosome segregation ATPase